MTWLPGYKQVAKATCKYIGTPQKPRIQPSRLAGVSEAKNTGQENNTHGLNVCISGGKSHPPPTRLWGHNTGNMKSFVNGFSVIPTPKGRNLRNKKPAAVRSARGYDFADESNSSILGRLNSHSSGRVVTVLGRIGKSTWNAEKVSKRKEKKKTERYIYHTRVVARTERIGGTDPPSMTTRVPWQRTREPSGNSAPRALKKLTFIVKISGLESIGTSG